MAVGDGSLWVSRLARRRADRPSEPGERRGARTVGRHVPPRNLSFADGSLWVADNGGILRIDAETNRIIAADDISGNFRVAAGGGFGWTTQRGRRSRLQGRPAGDMRRPVSHGARRRTDVLRRREALGREPRRGTVTGIDAITGTHQDAAVRHPVTTIAAGEGRLLVGVEPGRSVEDRIDGLSGDVAKLIALQERDRERRHCASIRGRRPSRSRTRPAPSSSTIPTNPPRKDGSCGPKWRPPCPTISADGRTYTFTSELAIGSRLPRTRSVTAETFRRSIERALSPTLGRRGPGTKVHRRHRR